MSRHIRWGLEESIHRAQDLMAEDKIPRVIVRDASGDYWIVQREGSPLRRILDKPVVVWELATSL
jgi:hypothetical protein